MTVIVQHLKCYTGIPKHSSMTCSYSLCSPQQTNKRQFATFNNCGNGSYIQTTLCAIIISRKNCHNTMFIKEHTLKKHWSNKILLPIENIYKLILKTN